MLIHETQTDEALEAVHDLGDLIALAHLPGPEHAGASIALLRSRAYSGRYHLVEVRRVQGANAPHPGIMRRYDFDTPQWSVAWGVFVQAVDAGRVYGPRLAEYES